MRINIVTDVKNCWKVSKSFTSDATAPFDFGALSKSYARILSNKVPDVFFSIVCPHSQGSMSSVSSRKYFSKITTEAPKKTR